MGVPKFFRWLSERYPKVNQRLGRVALADTIREHYGEEGVIAGVPTLTTSSTTTNAATGTTSSTQGITASVPVPDPLSTCSTVPPIDRLYIDMNGIIHGCSHSNASRDGENDSADQAMSLQVKGITEEQIFANVCFYLDRIVRDIVQPTSLVYLAIDGVAPRAKLNQQRSRRYRSGREGLIEQTIYDAHLKQLKSEMLSSTTIGNVDGSGVVGGGTGGLFYELGPDEDRDGRITVDKDDDSVQEIEPGRFAGKFLAHLDRLEHDLDESMTDDATSSSHNLGHPTSSKSAAQVGTATTTTLSQDVFHSNNITPGTPFFTRCTAHIQHFLQRKVSDDPAWQHLTIVFSGPNVPGEGEHKIMQFMREQRFAYQQEHDNGNDHNEKTGGKSKSADTTNDNPLAYHPNLRHCIMGQDGDLIMLGLLSHEPNLVLLREQVSFDMKLKEKASSTAAALQSYVLNANFELLHLGVLRDYFAYEFETSNVIPSSPWSLEHCIDDFVLMTFFVGNDFLPHMPAVDIADEAFDLLFYTYRDQRKRWLREAANNSAAASSSSTDSNDATKQALIPYLIDKGTIVSGQRLENFLQVLGKHETPYLEYKKSTDDIEKARQIEAKYGMSTIPSDYAKDAKEAADRAVFRERIEQGAQLNSGDDEEEPSPTVAGGDDAFDDEALFTMQYPNFRPVLTAASPPPTSKAKGKKNKQRHHLDEDEDGDAEALSERMGGLLRYSVKGGMDINISEEDLKGRYYSDKFGFSPFDAEKHLALRKAYIEGLVWNLKYYYEGCASWEWFYPYHYGPMLSDLVGIDDMLKEISYDGKLGKPLRPFEQLMACMPPSHADVLPVPYRAFMTDPKSTIADFYPTSFTIDMNGKRWQWEAVVLLPFIDAKRLLEAVQTVDESLLTDDERQRNQFGGITVFSRDITATSRIPAVGQGQMFGDIDNCTTKGTPFDETELRVSKTLDQSPVFMPSLLDGVEVPLPGFPTLRDGSVHGLWRKLLRVNVHGSKSRYKTACLEIENSIPEILPTETIADQLNGTLLWINYPHFVEALVTAVSDSRGVIRGQSSLKPWSAEDLTRRKRRISKIVNNYVFGEKMVGTGGVALVGGEEAMDHLDILLYVRPCSGLKNLDDGTVVKTFAKFEIEVPLFVTGWAPQGIDPRHNNLPVRLEKDPYRAAKYVLTDSRSENDRQQSSAFSKTLAQQLSITKRYQPAIAAVKQMNIGNNTLRAFHSLGLPASSLARHEWQSLTLRSQSGFSSAVPRALPLSRLSTVASSSRRGFAARPRGRSVVTVGIAAAMAFFTLVSSIEFGARTSTPSFTSRRSMRNSNDYCVSNEVDDFHPIERNTRTPPIDVAHGTTTLSFVFQGGIVAAVDSRATLGSFVGSKTTQKVLPINSHMIGTMAGGAADCMFWIRNIRCEAGFHELTEGRRMSVAHAARMLSNVMFELRGSDVSMGTMIMGFDDCTGGDIDASVAKIFYVDDSGIRLEGDCFAVGSGSTLALGILDSERRYDMSHDEAIALGIKAIRHATARDAYSGGYINVYLITAREGWRRVYTGDLDHVMDTKLKTTR